MATKPRAPRLPNGAKAAMMKEAEALLLLATGLRLQGDDPKLLTPGELAGGIVYVVSAWDEVHRRIEELSG